MLSVDFFLGFLAGAVVGFLGSLAFLWFLSKAYEMGHKDAKTH